MKNEKKLSRQGIRLLEEDQFAESLKANFVEEFCDNNQKLVVKGYFLGKELLSQILYENTDSAGIIISFGLNDTEKDAEGRLKGQLQLIIEPASGVLESDSPDIIEEREKYSTGIPGVIGPDVTYPRIKPK